MTEEKIFVNAEYVSELLGVSMPYAYKLIQRLNADLEAKGYLVVRGKVSKAYLYEKLYIGQKSAS